MKLLNHTSKYLSLVLLPVITLWAFAFYYAMLDEIYDSLDDGLGNQKILLTKRAKEDPSILEHVDFDKHVYNFKPISKATYDSFKESYRDTLMYMHNEDDFEPVRIYESTLEQDGEYYKLKIITSMVEEDDLIKDLVNYLVGLYLLMVIIILMLNNITLRKIWKPFYHSISQLKNFKIEKEEQIDLQPSKIDEFSLLNDAITRLVKKSRDSYTEQKHFIENASHELQTPLAISINKLELFLENNTLTENQTKELATVLDNLGRLTRLNKSLLLLSKIENKQFPEEEQLNISSLTQEIVTDFEDFAIHKHMKFVVDATADVFLVMNKDLAIIMLTNLIKNAIVHGEADSKIHIRIAEGSWSIHNRATTEALDEDLLFSRFKKIGTHKKSTGLGLAIAKAIADKYKLKLAYQFDGMHTFEISFPQKR